MAKLHYRTEDGISGYAEGDILINDDTGRRGLVVRDGRGLVLRSISTREAVRAAWAESAKAGDYLVTYKETGLTADEDPGSRCGYDDTELDAIRTELRARGLTLTANDRGLLASKL